MKAYVIPSKDPSKPPVHVKEDTSDMMQIKSLVMEQIKKKWILRPIHAVAAFLDPRQKSHLETFGFSRAMLDDGMDKIKSTMRSVGAPVTTPSRKRPTP